MTRRKPYFDSVAVHVGDYDYRVLVRIVPPRSAARVSADSPRYLDPGAPPRVRLDRVLRDGVDETEELSPWTRRAIEDAVRAKVAPTHHLSRAQERTR